MAEGFRFPGESNPEYWDCRDLVQSRFSESLLNKPLRRLATLHAIISFFFNTAVLALTINLAASMI